MINYSKMSVSLVVSAGLVASQLIVRGNLSSSALGSLTVPESVLNKKDITNDETGNNVDCFNVKKVNLSKKLENDVTIKADPDLNKKAINKGDIKFSKEELDSKELAKRLIIPIFSFASIGVATSFIKHLVDSKNEQQNKKEDDPIPGPNQEDYPGNNFLKIVIYMVLLWLFVKFVFVLRVRSEKGLFWLNLLTKLKLRPKKVKFIIDKIDNNDNPSDFIKNAAKKKLISPGDEVIIENNIDSEIGCANKILDNCDYIIFFVDPKAIVDPDSKTSGMKYTGVLEVVSVSGLIKYYIDMASNSNINSLKDLKDFSEKVDNFSFANVFYGKKHTNKDTLKDKLAIRISIGIIIQPTRGKLINMSWTRNNKEYYENTLSFLDNEKINEKHIKSIIDATNLYKSILLEAGFGIEENDETFKPNGKGNPGSIEIFQMLLCMEKLLKEDKFGGFELPAYKSLLIEFYYYSIFNPANIKNKFDENDTEWEKEVFKKVKELERDQGTVSENGLLEKIKELKEFLQKVNPEIDENDLKKKVYADELNNKVNESILQNKGMYSEINTYVSNEELYEAFMFDNPYGL